MNALYWMKKIPEDLEYEIPTGSHGIVKVGKLFKDGDPLAFGTKHYCMKHFRKAQKHV